MKKKISLILCSLAFCLAFSGCSSKKDDLDELSQENSQYPTFDNVERPEKITMMASTCMKFDEGLQYICDEYEEKLGIKLVIEMPDSKKYYEEVQKRLASNDVPNVIEMGSIYYPTYADQGVLWDMTKAWESSTTNVKNVADTDYIDALRIDGKLYGFPLAKGNGTITYARGDWMQELGISNPTNYDEFLNMLRKFKTKCDAPYTAAGVINSESPYNIYLREFYQDANPDFYFDSASNQYVDGMLQPQMKAALERMAGAYAEGLIDKVIVTNDTSASRDKIESGNAGVFNYWAGAYNLKMDQNLKKYYSKAAKEADKNDDTANAEILNALSAKACITPLPPIAETKYIERPPTALVITSKTKNPLGVYKYLLEYSHDGGEGQMLFTRGVEGLHWEKQEDGSIIAIPYNGKNDKLLEKSFYNPELAFTSSNDPIPVDGTIKNSLDLFKANSYIEQVPITSDAIVEERENLEKVRKEIMAGIILGETTVDEGLKSYQKRAGENSKNILAELNITE